MPQIIYMLSRAAYECLELPDPEECVLPNIFWGRYDILFTPAYWATQAWLLEKSPEQHLTYKLGTTLKEEIAACILGGYGIPAEIGLAAFQVIKGEGYLADVPPSFHEIYTVLSKPITIGKRQVRYRFAKQKSLYLSESLQRLAQEIPPDVDRAFRAWLMDFRGIGPKTASWVTRNWLDSDNVAVIDVHLYRAGIIAGFFLRQHSIPHDYFEMEDLYLQFSRALGVRATVLDTLIWTQIRGFVQ